MERSVLARTVVLACFSVGALAQKMEVGGERHQLLLIDATEISTDPGSSLPQLAEFVRTFAALRESDRAVVQAIGDRHLVALGSPTQVAAIEALCVHLRREKARDGIVQFQVDVRMCEVPASFVARELRPITKPAGADDGTLVTVLDGAAMEKLRAAMKRDAAVTVVQAPRITVGHLQNARIAVGEEVSYARDFDVEVVNGEFVAHDVLDTVFDGQEVEVLCANVADDEIGVSMKVSAQSVARPLKEVKTVVPGSTLAVSIQVPLVTGCRASQAVRMADDSTAVMAARRSDGAWLMSLMTPVRLTTPGASVR